MKKYQIRFLDSDWCGSYIYFESDEENPKDIAIKEANDYLEQRIERDNMNCNMFRSPYKPPKTISVVEYDQEKKKALRGGYKLKLTLSHFTVKYKGWWQNKQVWYS